MSEKSILSVQFDEDDDDNLKLTLISTIQTLDAFYRTCQKQCMTDAMVRESRKSVLWLELKKNSFLKPYYYLKKKRKKLTSALNNPTRVDMP